MIFPFEREAEHGAPMPDGLSLPDQLAFRFLSSMYASIRAGSITRERAISDKGKMTYQYNIANIRCLKQNAINAACEAIQAAAMCQKFLDMEGSIHDGEGGQHE